MARSEFTETIRLYAPIPTDAGQYGGQKEKHVGEPLTVRAAARAAGSREAVVEETTVFLDQVVFRIFRTPITETITSSWKLAARGRDEWRITGVQRVTVRNARPHTHIEIRAELAV